MRLTTFLAAMATSVMTVAALAGPVSAYSVVSETGSHGHYSLDDSSATPAGTCQYGQYRYSNWTYLTWVQVRAPHVFAADRNSGARDHRTVTWQFMLQRHAYVSPTPTTGWKTVKSSAVQNKIAYEDAQAPFTSLRVNYDGYAHSAAPPAFNNDLYRALVIIKWLKHDGSVEGTVKLAPSYYRSKGAAGDFVHGDSFCSAIMTSG